MYIARSFELYELKLHMSGFCFWGILFIGTTSIIMIVYLTQKTQYTFSHNSGEAYGDTPDV